MSNLRFITCVAIGLLAVLPGCECTHQVCSNDSDCSGNTPHCSSAATCVACTDNAQCTSGLCLPNNTCGACGPKAACQQGEQCLSGVCTAGCSTATAGCPNGKFCLAGINACVDCLTDTQCDPGFICSLSKTCVPGCSVAHPTCANGQVCNTTTGTCSNCLGNSDCKNPLEPLCKSGQCVSCIGNSDCKDSSKPLCNPATNSCVACLPAAGDNCPSGQYCRADDTCQQGCKSGSDCASGICYADHSCQGCTSTSECAGGQVCDNGTCTAACGSENPCGDADKVCCDNTHTCMDLLTDKNACGACGNVCGASDACCNGTCTGINTLQNCGGCNIACGPNQFCDGTTCHDQTFPNFCANKNVYVIYDGQPTDDTAANTLASTIMANCPSNTLITYGPQSNASWVDQTNGALLLGAGSTVVTAGGPFPNKPVKWLERTSKITKVYFSTNGVDTTYFNLRSDNSVLASMPQTDCTAHHDRFLIELTTDPSSSTLALIGYGVCGTGFGTLAASYYYANQILPNRTSYPDAWYIYDWTDTNGDSIPNAGDAFTKLLSGS